MCIYIYIYIYHSTETLIMDSEYWSNQIWDLPHQARSKLQSGEAPEAIQYIKAGWKMLAGKAHTEQ